MSTQKLVAVDKAPDDSGESQHRPFVPFDVFLKRTHAAARELFDRNIHTHFHFSRHYMESDAMLAHSHFQQTDLYAPEYQFWRPDVKKVFQEVSDGSLEPEKGVRQIDTVFPNHILGIFRMIYQSRKPILFLDLPMGMHPDPLCTGYIGSGEENANSNSTVEKIRGRGWIKWKNMGKTLLREEFILKRIAPSVDQALDDYSHLIEKKKQSGLRLLLTIGSTHRNMSHALRHCGAPVSRSFGEMSYLSDPAEEYFQRLIHGRTITNELVYKAYLTGILFKIFPAQENATAEIVIIRRALQMFTSKELQQLCEECFSQYFDEDNKVKAEIIREAMRKKGGDTVLLSR